MSIPILDTYVPSFEPLGTIQPFTDSDGTTYLKVLEGLRSFINNQLVTFINVNFADLGEAFTTEANVIIANVNTQLAAQDAGVTQQLADFVTNLNTTIDAQVNTAVAAYLEDHDISALVATVQENLDALTETVTNNNTYAHTVGGNLDAVFATVNGIVSELADIGYRQDWVAAVVTAAGTGRTALDGRYYHANADIAALITGAGATKTALDTAYGSSGGTPTAINVLDHGVVADGTTENYEALVALFADAATKNSVVFFPKGNYIVGGLVPVANGITIKGAGGNKSKLIGSNPGAGIFDLAGNNLVEDIYFSANASLTAQGLVICEASNITINRCLFDNYFVGVWIGYSTNANKIRVTNCDFTDATPSSSGMSIFVRDGDRVTIDNCNFICNPSFRTAFAIQVNKGNHVTINNCRIDSYLKGIDVYCASGFPINDLNITNVAINGCTNQGINIHGTGSIADLTIDNCEIASNGDVGITTDTVIAIAGFVITNCQIHDNGASGIIIQDDVTGLIVSSNRSSSNGVNGISLVDCDHSSIISGNVCRANSGYGIRTTGSSDHYVISGNVLIANTGANLSDGAAGANTVLSGNIN